MNEKYTPVELSDIFPGFDTDKFVELLKNEEQKPPKIETIDFLFEGLSLSAEKIKNQDILLRNYIYCMVITRKHLLEIDSRLKLIKLKENRIEDKESYAFRKLKYFEKKNNDAKQQIIEFICYGMLEYISGRDDLRSDLIDRNNTDNMWILGPTYDYQYNSQYYDPNYDFSTFAKFYNIPDVPLLKFVENIEGMIALKAKSIDDYFIQVKETVEKNVLLSKMVDRVSKNYHMHHRKELFESLLALFNENKYLAFVVNASIQLEGMFYELISIKYGKKEKQGTLVEKVDKAFNKNQILKHTLYPYFAFDVPELRNQVAHNGFVETDNIEMLAYELLLDLNCIVTLAENESIDKYKTVLMIRDKLNEVNSDSFEKDDEYYKNLSEILLGELYMSDKINSPFFWDIMIEPRRFDEELNYYIPTPKDDNMIYLKDTVYAVSNLIKKEDFWRTVLDSCGSMVSCETELNDFGKFVEKLKNMFISRLEGESKKLCCQVNANIQRIKNN